MTTQTEITAALTSAPGKKALKDAVLAALTSPDGKDTVRNAAQSAVQAELVKGFANHRSDAHADRKEVFSNQEWLFDAVDSLSKDLKDIFDTLQKIKDKD
jgi:hypothetical protein